MTARSSRTTLFSAQLIATQLLHISPHIWFIFAWINSTCKFWGTCVFLRFFLLVVLKTLIITLSIWSFTCNTWNFRCKEFVWLRVWKLGFNQRWLIYALIMQRSLVLQILLILSHWLLQIFQCLRGLEEKFMETRKLICQSIICIICWRIFWFLDNDLTSLHTLISAVNSHEFEVISSLWWSVVL